jgi:hypothetical protein
LDDVIVHGGIAVNVVAAAAAAAAAAPADMFTCSLSPTANKRKQQHAWTSVLLLYVEFTDERKKKEKEDRARV